MITLQSRIVTKHRLSYTEEKSRNECFDCVFTSVKTHDCVTSSTVASQDCATANICQFSWPMHPCKTRSYKVHFLRGRYLAEAWETCSRVPMFVLENRRLWDKKPTCFFIEKASFWHLDKQQIHLIPHGNLHIPVENIYGNVSLLNSK